MMGLGGSMPSFGSIRHGLQQSMVSDPLNQGTVNFGGLTDGNGMNPMDALRAHSNFATRFQSNPMGSPMSGPAGY